MHFDLSKMYHSVHTTEPKRYMRLMVWQYGQQKEHWKIFGWNVVAFGDTPATCITELAKSITADAGRDIDPYAASLIEEDCYCNHACAEGTEQQVSHMIGSVTYKEDGSLKDSGTIDQILSKGGFKVKMIVRNGKTDEVALAKMGGSVLGHKWEPKSDYFYFKPKVFLGKKQRNGLHSGPELTDESISLLDTFLWTKHFFLATIASIYNPAGLIFAYIIKFKLFFRSVCLENLEAWDTPLTPELQIKWTKLVTELVTAPEIRVKRGVTSPKAVGLPRLVEFSDGSQVAFSAGVYILFDIETEKEGHWLGSLGRQWSVISNLLIAMARVAPLVGITPPQSEMNGLVVGVRLINIVLLSLPQQPSSITFILDSECTIATVESDHGHQTPYLANRWAEVLETFQEWENQYTDLVIDKLQHIAGPLNISDIATRDTVTAEEVQEQLK